MQEITLQHDSHDTSKPGPVPWLLGFVALAVLLYLLNQQLIAINNDVHRGVRAVMAASNVGDINVTIDGRDVTLSGTIKSSVDRDWFVQSVDALAQVRVVQDEMIEHDPRKQAKLDRLQFQQLMQNIDTSVISFEPSSAQFAAGSDLALQQIASLLAQFPTRRIKIAGHTDSSGRRERNLELSRERANAVSSDLVRKGVRQEQLIAQGYGSTQPMESNDTEAGRAKNRRIEIILMN